MMEYATVDEVRNKKPIIQYFANNKRDKLRFSRQYPQEEYNQYIVERGGLFILEVILSDLQVKNFEEGKNIKLFRHRITPNKAERKFIRKVI